MRRMFARPALYIAALGGAANLSNVDACTTRLRLSVVDADKVSKLELKSIGARGIREPIAMTRLRVVVRGPFAVD
jgi:glucose-like phosphotransferase system IIB component